MSNAFYFPSLNELRFIAAFVVIIHHVEQFKMIAGMNNHYSHPFIEKIGGLGVTFFFTLSGYLLTYLMLVEKQNHLKVNVKKFYIRRILRIWPLYFLIVLIAFFVLPKFSFATIGLNFEGVSDNNLFYFVLMLANVALVINPPVFGAAPLWSVSSEEHFYLIYPHVFNRFKISFRLLSILILIFNVIKILFIYLSKFYPKAHYIFNYLNYFRIDCMFVGGLAALCYYHNFFLLKYIYSYSMQIISSACVIFFPYIIYHISYISTLFENFIHLIFAIFSVVIILNLSTNKQSLISFENKYMHFLGKISYGLYAFHGIIIGSTLLFIKSYKFYINDFMLYSIILLLTILISSFSYHFLEKPFLKLKNEKFTIINSEINDTNRF